MTYRMNNRMNKVWIVMTPDISPVVAGVYADSSQAFEAMRSSDSLVFGATVRAIEWEVGGNGDLSAPTGKTISVRIGQNKELVISQTASTSGRYPLLTEKMLKFLSTEEWAQDALIYFDFTEGDTVVRVLRGHKEDFEVGDEDVRIFSLGDVSKEEVLDWATENGCGSIWTGSVSSERQPPEETIRLEGTIGVHHGAA